MTLTYILCVASVSYLVVVCCCYFLVCYFHIVKSFLFFFFFSSRRRHTRFDCDWSSDVCSSDLIIVRCIGGHWDEWFRHEASDDDRRAIEHTGRSKANQRQFIAWLFKHWAPEDRKSVV